MPSAFLHTSPAHISTFTALLHELAPDERASHIVDESLLADARNVGVSDPAVVNRVREAMFFTASSNTADVVVCTCSTIGSIAEEMNTGQRFVAMRLDRAMADHAVQQGTSILVAAALQSTIAPTQALIEDSAQRLARQVHISALSIPEAWRHFEVGDISTYAEAIAAKVIRAVSGNDVVVLAQASMSPAAQLLGHLGVPVLSSPRLGVKAALHALSMRRAT